ncbi:ABC transporter permease [Microtetraspora niveoalba]|uniref:ABC transporter permease n=1 Tax=Microtetraspora niveoalba TaxID=46175 RepID=UPI0008362AA2|nr:ABC transporter permease [Microtetraspora niveoalba]
MTVTTAGTARPARSRARSTGALAVFRRALRSPAGLAGFVIAVVVVAAGLLAPWLSPMAPEATDYANPLSGPSGLHLLGTDELGRDQLSRVLYGINASVLVGLASVVLAALVGVPLGLVAGYFPKVDRVISQLVDVMLAFPNLILAVGLAAILGPSAMNAAIALAVGAVPGFVRLIRGEVLRLRGLDFVSSAIAAGNTHTRILWRHILPNATSTLLVQISVAIPHAILGEAMLSFLGLGIRPPTPSLGIMLAGAQQYIETAWWLAVFPGLAIVALTLAFNLFGDALRDALDPKGRRR